MNPENQTQEIQVIQAIKRIGAFSMGMFVGTVYGSVIATLTTFMYLNY